MIFSNMEYPGKNYRVQVYDAWLGEELEPMDNPKDGDKIVYRIIGENGQPVEQKTEIYQNGAWVEQGGGGGGEMKTATVTVFGLVSPLAVNNTKVVDDKIISSAVLDNGEYTVPIGDNGCWWSLQEEATVAVTGDIVFDSEEGDITITGDGTITFG